MKKLQILKESYTIIPIYEYYNFLIEHKGFTRHALVTNCANILTDKLTKCGLG